MSSVCETSYDADLRTVFLHPCPVIRVFIHHDVRPIRRYVHAASQTHIAPNRLNSRVHVRSRLTGEKRTVVTISHEQVNDGHRHTTLKLDSHSSSEMLAMMRLDETRTAEKVVRDGDMC